MCRGAAGQFFPIGGRAKLFTGTFDLLTMAVNSLAGERCRPSIYSGFKRIAGKWNTGISVNKLCVRFHGNFRQIDYSIFSSLKEPRGSTAFNRVRLNVWRIIPGDWGKAGSGWLAPPLKSPPKGGVEEAGFTSSSGDVRALPVTRKGAVR